MRGLGPHRRIRSIWLRATDGDADLDRTVAVLVDLAVIDHQHQSCYTAVLLRGLDEPVACRWNPVRKLVGMDVSLFGQHRLLANVAFLDLKHIVTPFFAE